MFRRKEELFQSGLKYNAWFKPPFDTQEKVKAIEDWKKGAHTLLGEIHEGRKMHRQAGEEFLNDFLEIVVAWVTQKLGTAQGLASRTAFTGLGRVGLKSEEGAGKAASATEAITQMRTLF